MLGCGSPGAGAAQVTWEEPAPHPSLGSALVVHGATWLSAQLCAAQETAFWRARLVLLQG